jgi:demethylspheroidene O-methyltransferase
MSLLDLDRYVEMRDRLIGNSQFRRWATANPLTRPVARRRARSLFDLCAGFVYSQVLFSCVRLRLFDILYECPQSSAVLANRLSLPVEGTERLLRAAVSLRLIERRRGDRYGLGALGSALIDNPGLTALIDHNALLYGDLCDPLALLRGERKATALARYWPYAAGDARQSLLPEQVTAYSALMSASQPMIAAEVLDAYPLERHRCLLDVGGGEGGFLVAASERAPHLHLTLFDLPPVGERARARLKAAGLASRSRVFGGDFLADPLPEGADVITLVRVIHDHDTDQALEIMRAVRKVATRGSTLLVAEPMAETRGAEPIGDAYFGFYLLAMGRGQPRTAARICAMLEASGFTDAHSVPTRSPMLTSLIVAHG